MPFARSYRLLISSLVVASWAVAASAEPSAPPDLCKAYFLEHEQRDYAAARKLYQKVLDSRVDEKNRLVARAGDSRCRDQLAAANFASLMPEDALVYAELTRPGEILEKLATMVGLTGKDMQALLAGRPSSDSKAPFYIPKEIAISPAFFEVFRAFGGAGMAITHFDPENASPPSGVMVIHHGDMPLVKGLLETAFQFSPTAEKVMDMPTFGAEVPEIGRVTGVLTESLLIVGTGRDLVEGVVGRLRGTIKSSLGAREDLREVSDHRRGATLFAYVNIQGVLKIAKAAMDEDDLQEFGVANALADLDSFRWATYSSGIVDGALGSRLTLRLADEHRSFAFNMMRLPAMSRRCLAGVPADAAGVFGMGLNPAWANAAASAARGSATDDAAVTAFDIGREFFGNIQEFCLFALPGKMASAEGGEGPDKIPNAGVILAVNDVAKSKALWNQLLSIPGLVGGGKPQPPKQVQIGETPVMAYQIPQFGRIYLADSDGFITIASTRNALKASLKAQRSGNSITKDKVMGKALDRMPKDSSIMLAVHIGRAVSTAAQNGEHGMAMVAGPAGELCAQTVAWFGIGQSPNQLTMQWSLSGLPDVNDALTRFGPMLNMFAGMQSAPIEQKTKSQPKSEKVVKKAPRKAGEAL